MTTFCKRLVYAMSALTYADLSAASTDLFLLRFADRPLGAGERGRLVVAFVGMVRRLDRDRTFLSIEGTHPADLDDIAQQVDAWLCPFFGATWIDGGIVVEKMPTPNPLRPFLDHAHGAWGPRRAAQGAPITPSALRRRD